jgi:MFS transporter, PPP family, 3-phenylpropionic acid transporter
VTSLALAQRLPVSSALPMARPAIVYAALFGAIGTFFPYASVFLASRGLDLGSIGLLLALQSVVSLIVAPAWGAIADRVGEISRVLLAASLIAGAGAAALAFAQEPLGLAVALSILAVGMGGMIPLADTRAVELAGESRERFARARAWGSVAFIVTSVATGWILSGRGPDALFILYVPLLVVTGIASWRLLGSNGVERRPSARRLPSVRPGAGIARLLRQPGLTTLLIGVIVIWTAVGAVMAFISIHVAAEGADLATIGLMWAVGAVVEIPIMLAFPVLARRVGSGRLLVLGAIAFALRSVGWGLADGPVVALLVAPLGGIGFALFYVGLVSFVARSVPHDVQATAQGLFTGMTFSLGSVVGTLVAGFVAPVIGLPNLFLAAALATGVGVFVVAWAVGAATPARSAVPTMPTAA